MTLVESNTADDDIEKQFQLRETILEQKLHEVYELQQEIATLKGRGNSKLPVSKLPAELVVEIFLYYHYDALQRHKEHDSYSRADRQERHQWWLTLTSICRYWRNIALQTPLLWSTLDPPICLEPYALKTFLARSAGRLLDIFLVQTKPNEQIDNALDEIFRISDRIRALRLLLTDNLVYAALIESTEVPFSSLGCLEVNGIFGAKLAHDLLDLIIPTAQNLRALTLREMKVEWDHLIPHLSQTITSFSLISPHVQWPGQAHGIFDALNNLSGLESLRIHNYNAHPDLVRADLARWEKKITFINLKCLDISGRGYPLIGLSLKNISSRPSSRLKLYISPPLRGRRRGADEECGDCAAVFTQIPLPSETFAVGLSFPSEGLAIDLSFDSLPHKPLFTVTFSHCHNHLAHLSREIPNILSNVEDITFNGEGNFTEILPVLPFMTSAGIFALQSGRHDVNVGVVSTLNKDAILYPKLRCLRIDNVVFDKKLRDKLSELLETRDRLGCRVPLLSLIRCSVSETTKDSRGTEDFKKWLGDKVDVLELDGIIL